MKKRLLAHRYLLIEEIGSGGMGTVFRATDGHTKTDVAVKILHPHFRKERTYVERFRSEAEIARLLKSSHVVGVLELGQDGDDHFLVMEYIKGESLSELLRRNGHLSLPDALRVALDVASALNEAHERLIVHRDIKPQNILVTPDGRAKVTDFGIARAGELTGLTGTGNLVGSVHYMAPEALAGRAEARSDIYALGVVLYEMLIGKVPIQGETAYEVIKAHTEQLPQSLPAILFGQELDALVSSCLAKQPEDRPQTAMEVIAAIRNLLGQAEEIEEGRSRSKPLRRLHVGYVLSGLLLAVVGASAGLAFASIYQKHGDSVTSTLGTPGVIAPQGYVIQQGDSLASICSQKDAARSVADCVNELRRLNGLSPQSEIHIGQVLNLPSQKSSFANPIRGKSAGTANGGTEPEVLSSGLQALDLLPLTASECDTTQSDRYCVYTVQPGDTISTIAEKAGLKSTEYVANWELLVQSNRPDLNSQDDQLQVGQKLRIPRGQGVVHTVLSAETLRDLADQYDTPVGDIMQANGISDANALAIGDELLIPNPKRFVSHVVVESSGASGATTMPIPSATPVYLTVFPHRNCDAFTYQETAQAFWEQEERGTSWQFDMDEDGDGIACEHLPSISTFPSPTP